MISGIDVQDTVKPTFVIRISTDNLIPDSVFENIAIRTDTTPQLEPARKATEISPEPKFLSDTTSRATRNSISDVTFYDSANFIRVLDIKSLKMIPFGFSEKGETKQDSLTIAAGNSAEGWPLPEKTFRNDWITIFIIMAVLLYIPIKKTLNPLIRDAVRFFFLKGIAEHSSRNTSSLFYRESTILNFISFLIISLFISCIASFADHLPKGMLAPSFVIVVFLIVAGALTVRHITCSATGSLSGKTDVFNEYLASIYLTYRFFALPAFVCVVLLVYTTLLKPEFVVSAGIILFIILYLYRILRLLLIFIKRNVSIFYFILYLCALEILPALIIVKLAAGSF